MKDQIRKNVLGFKELWAHKVVDGTKCTTLRSPRKRDPRPGELLAMYARMRRPDCYLLRIAYCTAVSPLILTRRGATFIDGGYTIKPETEPALRMAKQDGFASWLEMVETLIDMHGGETGLRLNLIRWNPRSCRLCGTPTPDGSTCILCEGKAS